MPVEMNVNSGLFIIPMQYTATMEGRFGIPAILFRHMEQEKLLWKSFPTEQYTTTHGDIFPQTDWIRG
jgi:hypothetical protein